MKQWATGNVLPNDLTQYLHAHAEEKLFRRRAVLLCSNDQWALICCTVEGFRSIGQRPDSVPSRRYKQVLLHEDWLTGTQCLELADGLQAGHATFDDIKLERTPTMHWSTEFVPVQNNYMPVAGYVAQMRFGQQGLPAQITMLIAPQLPYYPDTEEAARDWLPFPLYHGHSDGRNEHVVFMLPESRAYISDTKYGEDGILQLTVSGNQVNDLSLLIKGAYWDGKKIRHIEAVVNDAASSFAVPYDASRLEYCLIDDSGTLYDFHREEQYSRLRGEMSVIRAERHSLREQVRQASRDGEGLHSEFKPFVDPSEGLYDKGPKGKKTKLCEVIIAVIAFANTSGGTVYLGVEDDGAVTGIGLQFGEWAKGPLDDASLQRYAGELTAIIKDNVQGEVNLRVLPVQVDGTHVIVIEVAQAVVKPLALRQDNYLYARRGASSPKIPPAEWRSVLEPEAGMSFLNAPMQ